MFVHSYYFLSETTWFKISDKKSGDFKLIYFLGGLYLYADVEYTSMEITYRAGVSVGVHVYL